MARGVLLPVSIAATREQRIGALETGALSEKARAEGRA